MYDTFNYSYPIPDLEFKASNIKDFNWMNFLKTSGSTTLNTSPLLTNFSISQNWRSLNPTQPRINLSYNSPTILTDNFGNIDLSISKQWQSSNPAQQRMLSGTANFFDTGVGKITGSAISGVTSLATDKLTDELFGDSQFASLMGNIFSRGSHAAIDTMTNNLIKGNSLTEGLKQNVGDSVSGAVAGIAGNLVGQGINALGGDSKLSRGIGQGVSTGIGMVGANALSNVLKGEKAFKGISDSFKAIKIVSAAKKAGNVVSAAQKAAALAGKWNYIGLGGQIIGSGLLAALGPSKEYGGKYGNITLTMDTIYDLGQTAAGFFGPIGMGVSGLMALNKGLSNVFGSTDGMTKTDAILGSAFMPAPVKWLNMAGAKSTGSFYNQSWQNTERTNAFMENAFGNLSKRFDLARNEAGKTYGTFSKSARKKAQRNLDFANNAWNTILAMTDLDELQRIRSLSMSSINNQRYALMIQGGFDPIYRGKQGMKIFNNATNHNIGMRLLSGAALIDDKQMILSALGGMAVPKKAKRNKYRDETDEPSMLELWKNETLEETLEEERHNTELLQRTQEEYEREMAARKAEGEAKQKEREQKFAEKRARLNTANTRFHRSADLVQTALLQSATPPFTGRDYQEASEAQRQEKIEKFHEAEKIGEAALMADLAVSAAPLLLRGFRWAFNKAGLLVKVPKMAYSAEVKSPYYKIGQDGNLTFDTQNVVSEIKAGKLDFINEMLSPEYAEAAIRNMEEAEKTGLSYTPVFEKAGFKSLREDGIIPKFIQDSKRTWHARTGFMGGTPGKATEIEYNISLLTNIRHSTAHESGHVSRWGMGESKSELEFMKHKANQIFKDNGDVGVYEFGSLTGEGATNMRDLGKDMGITLRTPYPGYEKALEMLRNAEKTSNKGGIVKVLKLTKEAMPHIWRALQGLHFEYAIPLTTAATLYNTNK